MSNFKSIKEKTELELGPLTIFAGANSSGKSTFIQSILLIAQTLAHKVASRSVVLNGAYASLGQLDDLTSNGSESNQIAIKCTCKNLFKNDKLQMRSSSTYQRGLSFLGSRQNQPLEITCEISFGDNPSDSQRDLYQIQPRLYASKLSCISRDEDNVDQLSNVSIHESKKMVTEIIGAYDDSVLPDALRSGLAYEVEFDETSLSEAQEHFISAKPVGCILQHFLPDRIIYTIDTDQENAYYLSNFLQYGLRRASRRRRYTGKDIHLPKKVIDIIRNIIEDTQGLENILTKQDNSYSLTESVLEVNTLDSLNKLFGSLPMAKLNEIQNRFQSRADLVEIIYQAIKGSSEFSHESNDFIEFSPPQQLAKSIEYLDRFFTSSFRYLGPLRDSPKPLYPLAPTADPHYVGIRGEHTASVLELHKDKQIKYIPSACYESSEINCKTSIRTLEAAVTDWLKYLHVAKDVISRDKGKLGHELKVQLSQSAKSHDLTHVGVGVSQVLPILVMCLLADENSTLILEQPELHLHPKVQTLLGDFFLSMALCNKQCIVETHSEYLIDRLRFRIAAAPETKELNKYAKIYFVEKYEKGSSFREVVVNEYGAILDWPKGFFDQSQHQAEAILTAALAKKRAKKNKD